MVTHERNISVYTWGPLGLIARRGTSIRDGSYDPATHTFTPSPVPNAVCGYTCMTDHMGNVAALVDSSSGLARRQVL